MSAGGVWGKNYSYATESWADRGWAVSTVNEQLQRERGGSGAVGAQARVTALVRPLQLGDAQVHVVVFAFNASLRRNTAAVRATPRVRYVVTTSHVRRQQSVARSLYRTAQHVPRVRSKLKVQNSSTFQGPKLHFSSTKIIDKKPHPRRGHSKFRLQCDTEV